MKHTKSHQQVREKLEQLMSSDTPDLDAIAQEIIDIVKPPAPRSKPKRAHGTGSVYKLSGRRRKPWAAAISEGYVDDNQKKTVIGTYETKADAENALAEFAIAPTSEKRKYTLKQVFEGFRKKHYEYVGFKTKETYDTTYKKLLPLSKKTFANLRTNDFQRIIEKNSNLSKSSLSKIKTLVGLLYKYAYAEDIVHKNYAATLRLPKKEGKVEKEIFTDEEIRLLFNNDSIPYVDTILMYIFTGARPTELLILKKDNIDLEKMLITGGIKSDAGKDRIIPIHPIIQPYIIRRYNESQTYLIEREVEVGRAGEKHTERVPLTYRYYINHYYYSALKAAGVKRRTPHTCRHTFTSNAYKYNHGVDDTSIIKVLGHTDVSFSKNTYDHPDMERLRTVVENIKVPKQTER